jgi:glutamyl-tRNA synthetase
MTIRTRFAPSPTGYLHIGGVRTALFNWLLTQRHGGQFVLRIDDTDAQRNKAEALQPILDGFRWLGITWDEGPEVDGPYAPYFQSQRDHLYTEAAHKLLAAGHAYPCYRTKEELDAERKQAEAAKKQFVHRGEHRDSTPEACVELFRAKPAALRLKVPAATTVVLQDLIRGKVEWQTDLLGDPVILRPDGRALYNFATVVDDVAMKITHVVRAAEHLSNTPIQLLVYRGLGAPVPQFAHVPVVNEPKSKKKLSKRDMKKFVTPEVRLKLNEIGWTDEQIDSRDDLNPATVAFYREMGYLPAALINYLGRLGWSLDDKSEIIPLPEMIANFGLERVNEAPASFDPEKLNWLAGEYMKALPLDQRVAGVIPYLQRAGLLSAEVDAATRTKLTNVVEACGDRIKLFSDILLYGSPFFRKDPLYEPGAVQKRLKKAGAAELLSQFRTELAATEPFEVKLLENKLREFCESRRIGVGNLIHPLRVGTTGTEVGPGVFDCLAILGKEETLRRIDMALKLVQ